MTANSLDSLLGKILKNKGVTAALVVSRSGMHVSGDPPEQVHLETFVAMSAIILGAAETAAAELEQSLDSVEVKAGDNTLLLLGLRKKGILVLSIAPDVNREALLSSLSGDITKMKTLFA